MKAVIAIDSYKGSLSSIDAGRATEIGIKNIFPNAETVVLPIADGGEGTVDALCTGLNGTKERVTVTGPLGAPVTCEYGIIDGTAIIEMSSAAGITLISAEERNPMLTTTYGVGEVIKDAIYKGCRSFIVGIGGSATNDGGIGMLQSLGFSLLDENGKDVPFGAIGIKSLAKIDITTALPELKECTFKVACDVTNPLCGENGASAVYGPQKGATPDMVIELDKLLEKYANLTSASLNGADMATPGAGAAGGLGFAFRYYLCAELVRGIELILNQIKLEEHIKDADFVITGEGRLDSQTAMGKAPNGVALIAKKYGVPVIAVGGSVLNDPVKSEGCAIDACFSIMKKPCTLEEAMDITSAFENLTFTVEQIFRLIKSIKKKEI